MDKDVIPEAIAAFAVPSGSVMTVIKEHEDILGGPSYILNHDGDDDWISVSTRQTNRWFHDDWIEQCEYFKRHPGLTYLDVGANIGTTLVPTSKCVLQFDTSHTAVGVEASPKNVRLLEANIKLNQLSGSVSVISKGVSDSPATIHMAGVRGNANIAAAGHIDGKQTVEVELTTLDAIYRSVRPQMSKVLFMKIDIEGYEGHALMGATQFLSEAPPCYIKAELIPALIENKYRKYSILKVFGLSLKVFGFLGEMNYTFRQDPKHWDRYGQKGVDFWFQQMNVQKCISDRTKR